MFDLIATVLAWFYSLVPNYAVAIAMMTILIMLLLTPLTLKSTKSMLELQRIQPEMKRLQQQYRGDRQAMNEELMALYKEHKVNPLGGCLPLLIQAPIWIVMYRVFIGLTHIGPNGNFDPKYLDHSTQLYQDLSQTNEMNAFGLNLANSAAKSLQDSFVVAIPYLILVAVVVATYFVQQRQITARTKNNPVVNDNPRRTAADAHEDLPDLLGRVRLHRPRGVGLVLPGAEPVPHRSAGLHNEAVLPGAPDAVVARGSSPPPKKGPVGKAPNAAKDGHRGPRRRRAP